MLRWQVKILRTSYMVLDFLVLVISISIASNLAFRVHIQRGFLLSSMELYVLISVMYLSYISFFMLAQLYDDYMRSQSPITARLALRTIIAFIPGHVFSYIILSVFFPGYSYLFHIFHATLFCLISMFAKMSYFSLRSKGDYSPGNQRNVLLVGQSPNGRRYLETMRRHDYLHYNIIGFIHVKDAPSEPCKDGIYGNLPHLGGLESLERIVNSQAVDELIVSRPLSYDRRLENALEDMQKRGITITMLLNQINSKKANAVVTMIGDIPALKLHTVSLHESQLMAKRILDIAGSLVGMVIFGIAWLIFAPLIKMESKGPVIFKQDRVGKNGRVFKMWKFRSMFDGADSLKKALEGQNEMKGHMFKMTNDPRVTRIGRIIRKANIDELPQFYNVLIGDMSLVGTRPPTVDEVKEYQAHHYKRISVIPGITGMWQVSGGNKIDDFEEVVRLDDQYIRDWSIWKDVKIIAKTLLSGALVLNAIRSTSFKKKKQASAYEDKGVYATERR